MDILSWLTTHQLDQFAAAFQDNGLSLDGVVGLTHEDLRDGLGIARFEDRRRLLAAIEVLAGEREVSAQEVAYPQGLDAATMPTYLAHPWHALCAETHARVKLHWLTDTAELAVRWAVSVALAEVLGANNLTVPKRLAKLIREDIERPTLGRWLGILRELSSNAPDTPRMSQGIFEVYTQEFEPRFASGNRGGTLETSLLMLRNQIAHGGGMSQDHAASLLAAHMPSLSALLRALIQVTQGAQVVAVDGGQVSLLEGLHPRFIEPPPQVETERDGAWLINADGDAIPLLPLAIYEPVHMVDSAGELKDKPGGAAAQVFTRAYHDRLSYTPLGRDEAHSEVLDVDFFREVFRLDEQLDPDAATLSVEGVRWDDAIKEARESAQDLIGREQEIKAIKDWLTSRDAYDDTRPTIGWISGGPGLGKSMIMARVASDYSSGKHRGFYFHKFGGGGRARSNRRAFLKLLESALWSWAPLQAITSPPDPQDDGEALVDALAARLEAIQTLSPHHPKAPRPAAWIIIDNFDEVIEQDPSFLELVRKLALPGTVWLLCGRPEHGLDDELREGAEHIFEGGLPVMRAPDIRAMLLEGLGNARYALLKRDEDDGQGEIHNAFVERVVEQAQGLPLYVELLLGDLRTGALTVEDDEKLPDGLSDYYDGLMERVGLSTVSRDLPLLISLLARAEEPLDAHALAALLSPHEDDIPVYMERVKTALRVGQSLLRTSTTREGTPGYSLYHQSFQEYVAGRLSTADAPGLPPAALIAQTVYEAERLLYRSSERWESLPGGNLRNHLFRWGTTYALEFQGDHGLEEARHRLTDYAYLHARHEALPPNAVIDLVAEYGALIRRLPSGPDRDRLILWESFFRERAHILARAEAQWPSTRVLLQLAIEHADNSPITQAAQAWMEQGGADDWLWLRRPTRPAKLKENFARRVFEGHADRIEGAAVLPGERLLSWSVDHSLKVWNSATGEELETLDAHTGSVDGALMLQDQRRALAWDREGGLICWDLELGEATHHFTGHERAVLGAVAIDEHTIISWSEDKTLRTWSLETGDPLEVMTGHTRPIRDAVLCSPEHILSWSDDKTLRLWSTQGGEALAVMKGHTREVVGAILLPGERALSWDMDNTMRAWQLPAGEELATFEGHEDTPLGAMWLEDETLLSWGKDNTLRRWSMSGEELATLTGHKDWVDGVLMLSATRALSWSKDMSLMLWDLEKGKKITALEGHAGWVRGATQLSGGEILSWSGGGTLRIWEVDLETAAVEVLAVLEGHTAGVRGALELESGRLLSWSWDGSMRLWEWEREEEIAQSVGHRGWIHAHIPFGSGQAMTWASDALAVLWDMNTGHPDKIFAGHEKSVDGVLRLEDGRLVTYSGDQTLRVWDMESGECISQLEGHDKKIQGALELGAGRVLSWSSDATLKLWDACDGACLQVFKGHKKLVQGARAVGEDRILSWASDGTVKLWEVSTGELVHDMSEHSKLVKGVRLLPDGTALSWSSDKTLKRWDLQTGACLSTLEGHKGLVLDARALDAQRILSIGKNNLMILWDMESGEALQTMETEDVADGVTLLEDGSLLSWFRKPGHFVRWDLERGEALEQVSYEHALRERVELWRARQQAGRFQTLEGPWRSHGVSGGAVLFLDGEQGTTGIEWKDTGSWSNMLLTPEGVVTVHAGQYFHPLHLHLGRERVTLEQARAHLQG